jgi:hypothetical protein
MPLASTPSSDGKELARSNGWNICATQVSSFVGGLINSVSGVCGSTMQIFQYLSAARNTSQAEYSSYELRLSYKVID